MATTINLDNLSKPAPRWYRILKRVLYYLAASSIFTGTLNRIGISADDQLLIVGWMIMLGEIFGMILGNGETYVDTKK